MDGSGEKIRAFICFKLPEDIRQLVYREATRKLQATDTRCSWVTPDRMHLTLKFLGDVPSGRIPEIASALEEALEGRSLVSLSLGEIGKFGGRIPRVIWAGVEGDIDNLAEIASSVDEAMAGLGFEREKRRYSPHLTLARVRKTRGIDRLLAAMEEISLPPEEFEIGKVILMKSELTPHGSVYTPLAEFELQ